MVTIPPIYGEDWGMVCAIVLPTLGRVMINDQHHQIWGRLTKCPGPDYLPYYLIKSPSLCTMKFGGGHRWPIFRRIHVACLEPEVRHSKSQ
jgi:hypothetical protein